MQQEQLGDQVASSRLGHGEAENLPPRVLLWAPGQGEAFRSEGSMVGGEADSAVLAGHPRGERQAGGHWGLDLRRHKVY